MTKKRTMYYRRFDASKAQKSLQEFIDLSYQSPKSTFLRSFSHSIGVMQGLKYKQEANCSFLHISYHIPDQPTSLVPKPGTSSSGVVKEKMPPQDHDYMEGDIFVLMRKNHVLLCPSATTEGLAKDYFKKALDDQGHDFPFSLDPVANMDKIDLIEADGVKAINLKTSAYKAATDKAARTTKSTLLGKLGQELLSIICKSQNVTEKDFGKYDNLSVRLELTFNSRKKGAEISAGAFQHIGQELLEDKEDGFVLVTNSGNKISRDDINIHKTVDVKKFGRSIDRDDAWANLLVYFKELKASGTLVK
ncbi:hypothetical protein GW916_15555 [bacterium]|nr:hypothetical protein [bacterium]